MLRVRNQWRGALHTPGTGAWDQTKKIWLRSGQIPGEHIYRTIHIFALIKFSIDLLAFNSRYCILFDFNGSSLCAGSWLPFQSHEDFVRILRLHCSRLPYWWWYRFLNLFLSKSSNTLLRPSIPCRRREENLHIYLAKLIDNYSKT